MLLRIDELNALRSDLERYREDKAKLLDLMNDWQLLAYADGKTDVEDQLRGEAATSIERIRAVCAASVGGKTIDERILDEEMDDLEDLIMLFENERQRVYNTAGHDTATELGAKFKTWHTMEDERVRDTHFYLEGTTKPMDEPFYTYNGNAAMYPRSFEDASENVNCRCWVSYNK